MAHRRAPSVFADRSLLIRDMVAIAVGVVVAVVALPLLLPDISSWWRIAVMVTVVWSVQWALSRWRRHHAARESEQGVSSRAR